MKKESEAGEPEPGRTLLEILVALSEGDSSAAAVLEAMDRWPGGNSLPLGSFYRHLERGVAEGWIEVAETSPGQTRNGRGRPSRHYRLTAGGRCAATRALGRMARLTDLAQAAGYLSQESR